MSPAENKHFQLCAGVALLTALQSQILGRSKDLKRGVALSIRQIFTDGLHLTASRITDGTGRRQGLEVFIEIIAQIHFYSYLSTFIR